MKVYLQASLTVIGPPMAKKKLTAEDEQALARLRERLVLTIQFMEDVQDFPSGKQILETIDRAAREGDLRALRLLAKEIDAMTIALAPSERDGLEALLLSRLNIDKEAERAELHRQVAQVLRRGTIASEKECRRLEEYADLLEATEGDPSEIAAIQRVTRSS